MNRRLAFGLGVVLAMFAGLWWLTQRGPAVRDERDEALTHVGSGAPTALNGASADVARDAGAPANLEVHVVAAGKPVASAIVDLVHELPSSIDWLPNWSAQLHATTDDAGIARVTTSEGTVLISVRAQGFANLTREVHVVGADVVTTVTVMLEIGTPLRGLARDEKGGSIAPAVIRAIPLGDRIARRLSSPLGVIEVSVDARGAFVFPALANGQWRIEGIAEGSGAAEPILISVPSDEEVLLTFRASTYLEGVVVTADGGAAAHATVTLIGPVDSTVIEAGATGTFSSELAPGSYRVRARKDLLVGSAPGVAVLEAGKTASTRVVLGGAGGTLAGRVSSSDGGVVSGAKVNASPHDADGLSGSATTTNDGSYEISSLAPGAYDLEVLHDAWVPAVKRGLLVADGDRLQADLVVSARGRIEGHVVDEAHHGLSTTVQVHSTQGPRRTRVAQSNANGDFQVEGLVPGGYMVSTSESADEFNHSVRATVKADETTHVELARSRTVAVDVEVDTKACPDSGAVTVALAQTSRLMVHWPVGQRHGVVKVAPGAWNITAFVGHCGGNAVQKTVVDGQPATVKITLHALRQEMIKVTVREPSGVPSVNAEVSATPPRGGVFIEHTNSLGVAEVPRFPSFTVQCSNQGRSARAEVGPNQQAIELTLGDAAKLRLKLNGARGTTVLALTRGENQEELTVVGSEVSLDEQAAGALQIDAVSGDRTSLGHAEVELKSGQTGEATVVMTQGGTVRGRVATHAPPGVELWINGGAQWTRVASDGTYELKPVGPGEVKVKFDAPGGNGEVVKPVQVVAGAVVTVDFP